MDQRGANVMDTTKECEPPLVVKEEEEKIDIITKVEESEESLVSALVQQGSYSDEYVEDLKQALDKYYQKYKAHKKEVSKLESESETQQAKIRKLEDKISSLSKEAMCERTYMLPSKHFICNEFKVVQKTANLPQKNYDQLVSFMKNLPKSARLRPSGQLKPVSWSDELSVNYHKAALPSASLWTLDLSYQPKSFKWCSPGYSALVYLPVNKTWPYELFWTRRPNTVRHLFYDDGNLVYYAGRFKTVELWDYHTDGVFIPVSEEEYIFHFGDPKRTPWSAFVDPYSPGMKIRGHCVGLQFVDFDMKLYEKLYKGFEKEQSEARRPQMWLPLAKRLRLR